ncbi:General substrate transporter [Metarhizium guizhouense ARSEF 977]|uniref:General substrate transporter n=1 Tax=Metarhizium guizhouense (strain ARSEF 977) TaxID=1276136 RepID=A0A0B4GVH4_METGA|nr:General substrate transporter [Metarhizium guizhouense ARSEF 977]
MAHPNAKANGYNFTVSFFATLGSFTYGFNSAIIGSVIGLPSFYSYFEFTSDSAYGSSLIGAANGGYTGAGVVGALTVFCLLDKIGRKRAIQISAFLCLISAALQAGSVHIGMFLAFRVVNGLAVAWINCAVPTYISEISPASQRGRVLGSHGFVICVSYGMSGWCGFGTYYESNPTIQWRLLLALQCVSPLLLCLGSPWLPESPRWLMDQGRHQEGLAILQRLHETEHDTQHLVARHEFHQIRNQLELDRVNKVRNLWQIMKIKSYRTRLLYGFWIQAACMSTGVLVLELQNLGLTGSLPLLLLAIYNSWAAFLNYLNTLYLDRFGRKKCMCGCMFSLIMVTALVANCGGASNTNPAGAGAAVAFTFLFVSFYGSGLDVSSYVYCTEIFPTNIRAQGVGFSIAGLFLMTTIYASVAGPAFYYIGWKYYIVFISMTAFMLPLIIFKFPETKGLTLEEIGQLFGDEVAVEASQLPNKNEGALEKTIDGKDAKSVQPPRSDVKTNGLDHTHVEDAQDKV